MPLSAPPVPPRRMSLRPNRQCIGLGLVLLAMGYAGTSQGNAAAWLLAFTVGSMALVSALHTWRNLSGLAVTTEPPEPVFAGESLPVRIRLRQPAGRRSVAVRVSAPDGDEGSLLIPEVQPGEAPSGELRLPAPRRGRFVGLHMELSSTWPLGFFTARIELVVPQVWYVYPRPEGELPLPEEPAHAPASATGSNPEGDDFAGVRDWRLGDSMRHVDWKAAARSERLVVKQWQGDVSDRLRLAWDAVPHPDPEVRLSQLSRWVILAARRGAVWELHLPGRASLGPAGGEGHFHDCLRALAEVPEQAGK